MISSMESHNSEEVTGNIFEISAKINSSTFYIKNNDVLQKIYLPNIRHLKNNMNYIGYIIDKDALNGYNPESWIKTICINSNDITTFH